MSATMRYDTTPMRGAYGLRIGGGLVDVHRAGTRLVEARANWPLWDLSWEPTAAADTDHSSFVETWSPDRAVVRAQPRGRVTIDRELARTTLHMSEAPSAEAVVHPYLVSTGVVAGAWLGRSSFHAGAFLLGGQAWGILGGREMGKTSLLMCLHRSGAPILTDDLLVLDGAVAFAGPRCLDLRRSAVEQFDEGQYLGRVGNRDRWRVALPPSPAEVPFGGWVLLAWAEEVSVQVPPPSLRLAGLASHRGLLAREAATPGLLDGLAYPMVVFARPKDWGQVDEAMAQLVDSLGTLAARELGAVASASTRATGQTGPTRLFPA
jgi:hypothetical protein